MSFSFFFFMLIASIISIFLTVFLILRRRSSRTEFYCEGIRNENDGRYSLALRNYEDAINELRKLRTRKRLRRMITGRIRILRTTIEYEKNFQVGIEQ